MNLIFVDNKNKTHYLFGNIVDGFTIEPFTGGFACSPGVLKGLIKDAREGADIRVLTILVNTNTDHKEERRYYNVNDGSVPMDIDDTVSTDTVIRISGQWTKL